MKASLAMLRRRPTMVALLLVLIAAGSAWLWHTLAPASKPTVANPSTTVTTATLPAPTHEQGQANDQEHEPEVAGSGAAASAGDPPAAAPEAPSAIDIFAVRNWEPPPAAPAPMPDAIASNSPAAANPAPPPLPFRYLGRITPVEGPTVFFVEREQRVLVLRPGQRIDRQYRVGRHMGEQLRFVYLPLKIEQSLAIGSGP